MAASRAAVANWVKCTDPIPREILEEVRSTVLVWMKNLKNYVEEAETYILNDEHTHQEVVGRGSSRRMLRLAVEFHDRLSSEIKDEICSKLASALRALKSRISRICGINELERRTVPSQNKHESTYIHDLRNDQNY